MCARHRRAGDGHKLAWDIYEDNGNAAVNFPMSIGIEMHAEELGLTKIKKLRAELWHTLQVATTELWIERIKLDTKPKGPDAEERTELIKAIFKEGLVTHLPLREHEVHKYPAKKKKKFIEKYAPELAQKEETLTVKAGDHVSNHVHGAGTVAEIGEQEGTVVYTNLAQIEPKQQIHGHIVGASGVTACEQGLVNSVYVEQGRHQYVTKVRTRRAKARIIGTPQTAASVEYTVIATNRTKRTIEKGTLMAEMSASPELSAQSAAALKRIRRSARSWTTRGFVRLCRR